MVAKWLIYALADPRDDSVFYVGRSSSGLARPRCHWSRHDLAFRRRFPVTCKCISILSGGFVPRIVVLEEHHDGPDRLNDAEIRFIRQYREAGVKLTNLTDGGEGANGRVVTDEERAMRSDVMRRCNWNRGMTTPPEVRAKQSEAKRGARHWRFGKHVPDETRAKIAAALRGRKHSAERIAKNSESHRTQEAIAKIRNAIASRPPISDETRAKMALAQLGKKCSPESCAKRSVAAKGRRASPESRLKMSIAQKGRTFTEEAKEKISNTLKLRAARRRLLKALAEGNFNASN